MPLVDLSVGAEVYLALDVPEECTVGRWKQLLDTGFLGDKILYARKLTCRDAMKGMQLQDTSPLPKPPDKLYVEGPGCVVKMLELGLRKKLGPPARQEQPVRAEPALQRTAPSPPVHRRSAVAAGPPPATAVRPQRAPGALQATPASSLKSSGEDERMRFFCAGLQGMRQYMEDRTCGMLQLPGHKHAALFGVFDGHGGQDVAELAAQLLPRILAGALSELGDPAEALRCSFRRLDDEIWGSSNAQPHAFDWMGSTAVVSLVLHEAGQTRLICANVGDSRAVLCRQAHAMDLSVDQKPQNPEERKRIDAAGGAVLQMGPCWRIDAGLNLSRALGDFHYKNNTELPANQQKVISEPELKEVIIDREDQFVVMGSDGVFDVLTSEALVLHLRGVQERSGSWAEAIESALKSSIQGGDNVSLCLVEFLHAA